MRELGHRWVFGAVAVGYAALVLSLLPWASQPGYDTPYLIGIYGVSICVADLCTVLVLLRQYRRDGQRFLLALAASYLLSALLVVPLALSFPDAFGAGQYFGHDTTSAILFISWRVGAAALLLAGVLLGVHGGGATPQESRSGAMLLTVLATLGVAAVMFSGSLAWHIKPLEGGHFNLSSFVAGWAVV